MRSLISSLALMLLVAGCANWTAAGAADAGASAGPVAGSIEGNLKSVGKGVASIQMTFPSPLNERELVVSDASAKQKLTNVAPGDLLKLDVENVVDPHKVIKVVEIRRPVPQLSRFAAFGISFVVLIGIAALVTRWKPHMFLIGVDNRYSNSQCQLALWFGAVATVYLAAVSLRIIWLGWDFIGGVGLPQNLVILTGLSAFTFGGAKVITAQKDTAKTAATNPNFLKNLVQNDKGKADLGDLQMMLIVVAAVVIFVLSSFHFLATLTLETPISLPDADTTLLSGFGIGQGAYLIKKAALKAGDG